MAGMGGGSHRGWPWVTFSVEWVVLLMGPSVGHSCFVGCFVGAPHYSLQPVNRRLWVDLVVPVSLGLCLSGASVGHVPPLTAVRGLRALVVRLTFRFDLAAVPSFVFILSFFFPWYIKSLSPSTQLTFSCNCCVVCFYRLHSYIVSADVP